MLSRYLTRYHLTEHAIMPSNLTLAPVSVSKKPCAKGMRRACLICKSLASRGALYARRRACLICKSLGQGAPDRLRHERDTDTKQTTKESHQMALNFNSRRANEKRERGQRGKRGHAKTALLRLVYFAPIRGSQTKDGGRGVHQRRGGHSVPPEMSRGSYGYLFGVLKVDSLPSLSKLPSSLQKLPKPPIFRIFRTNEEAVAVGHSE